MFGRQSATTTDTREVVDDAGTPIVDEPVTTDDGEHTQRIMTRRPRPFGRSTLVEEPVTTDQPVVVPQTVTRKTVTPKTVVPAPVTEKVVEKDVDAKRWVHVSATATLSLVAGTLAIAATLTGLLAPLGFAAGVVAILLGCIGFSAVSQPNITGHGLVLAGILLGVVAIVLSMLAMSNDLSWLSKDTNEITSVHNWINDHMHWMRRF